MLIQNERGVCPGSRQAGGWRGARGQSTSLWRGIRRGHAALTARPPVRPTVLGVAVGAAVILGVGGTHTAAVWVERAVYVMGTELHARIAAPDRAQGAHAIEAAFNAVRAVDDLLSTWRSGTPLAQLNAGPPGTPVALPPALANLLADVDRWQQATDGAFDPAIGALVDAWDLRGRGRRPSASALAGALAASGLHRFTLDARHRTGRRPNAAWWIDSGGFGKGVALREAWAVLRRQGVQDAMLNFGGQVLALGEPDAGAAGWEVPVAHPARRGQAAARLILRDRSAATSAQSERFVDVEGERFGHILDPRHGMPVPAWGSVTVVAAEPLEADILSTALFVMGPDQGLRWLDAHPGVAALFLVLRDGETEARWSPAMEPYLVHSPAEEGA